VDSQGRRYSKGYGFAMFYVVGNDLAAGGQSWSGTSVLPEINQFFPGQVPTDLDQRNRLLNYQRDTSIRKHRVRWNWIVDLPFGKGKPVLGGAGPVLNRIVGGWQVAGLGSLSSTYFALPTGIMGVPADYKPAGQPVNPLPANANRSDPMYSYFGGNTTWVTLKNGTQQRTTFDPRLHPWRQQYFPSTRQWGLDASLFKTIPIKERFSMRLNADFFNVLNHPGNPSGVGSTGVLSTRSSGMPARVAQLILRVLW